MSIHSLPMVDGVDVADLIAREEYGADTLESQDNPTHDDWEVRVMQSRFRELRLGDKFTFAEDLKDDRVWEYRGDGWYNIPYSGGPWIIPLTSFNAEVSVTVLSRVPSDLVDRQKHNANRDLLSHPPIPEAKLFWHEYGYQEPVAVWGWQWSYDFNRWSAYVEFEDGWRGFTYPKHESAVECVA